MNKNTLLFLMILTLLLTGCGSTPWNTADRASANQSGSAAGELSAGLQVALGTIKLDETANAVTAEQADELLPLWETLQVLETSDTAATEERDALVQQIQETMTKDQLQSIAALNLSRQDMFAIMQSQGLAFGGGQSNNTRNNGSSGNNGRNFAGGGFQGPPDGGGFPGAGPGFFQGQAGGTQSTGNTNSNANRAVTTDPNRIPTPLIQAVVQYLKKIASA